MSSVSVIIPNYNRSGLVNETVRNVLSQSLPPFEVIVVDDGSTDDSVASLRAEFGQRIRLIEQTNQGPGAARNAGLEVAQGEFIWLMDSDDLASLNKLEVQVAALQQNHADVVYGPWARVFFEGQNVRLDGPVLQQQALPANRDVLTWFMTDWSLVLQQCLIRKSAVDKAGRYSEHLRNGEDGEFFVRILSAGASVCYEDKSLLIYRNDGVDKLTTSGTSSHRRIRDWAKCLIAMHDTCGFNQSLQRHIDFQARMWRSRKEVVQFCPDEKAVAQQLDERIQISPLRLRFDAISRRGLKAIRTRITKTHWSPAFQTGPITSAQIELIRELGLSVS